MQYYENVLNGNDCYHRAQQQYLKQYVI